ncbi:2Fe-2S iron-sulfur cluster-binding protein [Curvibacter sp. HBC28]|uniref:2Fe-2S iron-sulfur cluster-binding protein n=1 Tax=Curvibacter microcysteis TaxID=3026419 RepID=A0ABT5M9D2_9BURK|nr:2Fe-2S iron-sulfur cluster-binding protein [Curvibacter sp. HBC28]MDD0813188.1 2Fe-2S iron-sulfur cluster-binding protein [Curvibacter sp. HBC28]
MDILVQPLNRVIRATPGVNLLEALRAAQVPMSYSCLSGRCGICRCRVIDGEVLDGGREQQRPLDGVDGGVLACQTYVTEPCTIEVPAPEEAVVHQARVAKGVVTAIEPLAADIRRLLIKVSKPIAFSPGQYVQIAFTPAHIRPYSMANLPGQQVLEFHVQLMPKGRVSHYIATQLKVGDSVKISGPLGAAYLRHQPVGPLLCVAGGTGLASVLSVVRGAVAAGMSNPIHLYLGVRSPREMYGLAWLDQLRSTHPSLQVHVVMASGADVHQQRRGLVTQAIEQDHPSLQGWQAYVCGSPPMVESTTLLALRKGMEAVHLHAEAFYMQAD